MEGRGRKRQASRGAGRGPETLAEGEDLRDPREVRPREKERRWVPLGKEGE